MLTIQNYIKAKSLEEAYILNQKKTAVVLGGFTWLKMQDRTVQTAIDLSELDLNGIEETQEEFRIGCMTPLRALETHPGFLAYTRGTCAECVRHIIGVQFRNCATVGGSIFGRFGFSDVLTFFLALDCYVELYKRGLVPLWEFAREKPDRDILVRIIVRKHREKIAYESFRNEAVDFPVVAVCAAGRDGRTYVSIGARPGRAERIMPEHSENTDWERQLSGLTFGSNLRASGEYRKHLAAVLCQRAMSRLEEDDERTDQRSGDGKKVGILPEHATGGEASWK